MRCKVESIEEEPFDRTEPSIRTITLVSTTPKDQPAPFRKVVLHGCHSEGAPTVGEEFVLLPAALVDAQAETPAQDKPPAP